MRPLRKSNGRRDSRPDQSVAADAPADLSADRLDVLMDQISRGSRAAFATLFDQTCGAVRDTLAVRLPDRQSASAVLAATYVEVWWLAGCRTSRPGAVVEWIDAIVQRRIGEVFTSDATRSDVPASAAAAVCAHYAVLELAALLGRPVDENGSQGGRAG
jgi:hypothetical protein